MKKTFFSILMLISFIFSAYAEDTGNYVPYEKDEFPVWAQDLRRFEIVFFGTIPFSFFYSNIGYSFYNYGVHEWDPAYAPAILGNKTPPILTNMEKMEIVYSALGVSFTAALVDFILGKIGKIGNE